MSNYRRTTKHPIRGDWQWATWIDNLFGPRKYGVVFPSDEEKMSGKKEWDCLPLRAIAFDPEKVELETRE